MLVPDFLSLNLVASKEKLRQLCESGTSSRGSRHPILRLFYFKKPFPPEDVFSFAIGLQKKEESFHIMIFSWVHFMNRTSTEARYADMLTISFLRKVRLL